MIFSVGWEASGGSGWAVEVRHRVQRIGMSERFLVESGESRKVDGHVQIEFVVRDPFERRNIVLRSLLEHRPLALRSPLPLSNRIISYEKSLQGISSSAKPKVSHTHEQLSSRSKDAGDPPPPNLLRVCSKIPSPRREEARDCAQSARRQEQKHARDSLQ